ncbi:putative reverse transcriptase domain-containing protein [Tanacetum coccineum]
MLVDALLQHEVEGQVNRMVEKFTLGMDEINDQSEILSAVVEENQKGGRSCETMGEIHGTILRQTRADYGRTGVDGLRSRDKENFETKRASNYIAGTTNWRRLTTSASKLDENLYQAWERFKKLLMKCPQHYLTKILEVVLFYNGWDVPTRQILDLRGAIPSKTVADAKVPTYTKDFPSRKKGLTLEEVTTLNLFLVPFQEGDIRANAMGFIQRNNSIDYCESDASLIRCIGSHNMPSSDRKISKGIAKNVLVGIGKFVFPVDFIILDMPKDIKVPLILRRPFLSTAHAKIDVFKRKITLRVGEEKLVSKIRRDQVDDLMPTIEEGDVIEEFRARNDARMDKLEYKGNNVVGALKKLLSLLELLLYLTNFAIFRRYGILIVMKGYMGDVIFVRTILREIGLNARRFEGQ